MGRPIVRSGARRVQGAPRPRRPHGADHLRPARPRQGHRDVIEAMPAIRARHPGRALSHRRRHASQPRRARWRELPRGLKACAERLGVADAIEWEKASSRPTSCSTSSKRANLPHALSRPPAVDQRHAQLRGCARQGGGLDALRPCPRTARRRCRGADRARLAKRWPKRSTACSTIPTSSPR